MALEMNDFIDNQRKTDINGEKIALVLTAPKLPFLPMKLSIVKLFLTVSAVQANLVKR